jgi:hypothetical protein
LLLQICVSVQSFVNISPSLLWLSVYCYSFTASTFKKCDKKQSDFDQCLPTVVKDALSQLNVEKKEVGLPSFEPLEVPSLVIGAGTGPVGFAQNYKNVKLSGFTKTDSLKAK